MDDQSDPNLDGSYITGSVVIGYAVIANGVFVIISLVYLGIRLLLRNFRNNNTSQQQQDANLDLTNEPQAQVAFETTVDSEEKPETTRQELSSNHLVKPRRSISLPDAGKVLAQIPTGVLAQIPTGSTDSVERAMHTGIVALFLLLVASTIQIVEIRTWVEFLFILSSVTAALYESLPKLKEMYERRHGNDFSDEGFTDRLSCSLNILPTPNQLLETGAVRSFKMRTLLDKNLTEAFPNDYVLDTVIKQASAQCDVDSFQNHPFLCFKGRNNKLDRRRFLDHVINLISSEFRTAYVAEALGVATYSSKFAFGLTYEKKDTPEANRKYRCLLMELEQLKMIDTEPLPIPEPPKGSPGYFYAIHRQQNLKTMLTLLNDPVTDAIVGTLIISVASGVPHPGWKSEIISGGID